MITTVENLCELRNNALFPTLPNPVDNVIYVKGYRYAGDGGGGFFTWKTFSTGTPPADDDGVIIKPSTSVYPNTYVPGRWLRQIDGPINVRYYGCFGSLQYGDGRRIQKAIDYAKSINGGIVFLPAGAYKIYETLIMKDGVSLIGEGLSATKLYAGYLTNDPIQNQDLDSCGIAVNYAARTDTEYLIKMAPGRIIINISDISFIGLSDIGQPDKPSPDNYTPIWKRGCVSFEATVGVEYSDGGLWRSTFKNINIYDFNGTGMFLKGTPDIPAGQQPNYLTVNQFLIFENIHIIRRTHASQCLFIYGQHGQLTFLNCNFSGIIYDGADANGSIFKTSKQFDVIISDNNVQPAVISFINSTFADSEYGVYMNFAENVTFDNCWFERLDNAVTAAAKGNPCKGITITNSRFANAAGFGSLNVENLNLANGIPQGRCITSTDSEINVYNNYVAVSDTQTDYTGTRRDPFIKKFIVSSSVKGVRTLGNTFQDIRLGSTTNIATNTFSVITNSSGNYINTEGNRVVFVTASTTVIQTIKSSLVAGEELTIRATGNSVIFNNSKNIVLTKPSPFTLNNGETATFIKIDNISGVFKETWQLISVNKV